MANMLERAMQKALQDSERAISQSQGGTLEGFLSAPLCVCKIVWFVGDIREIVLYSRMWYSPRQWGVDGLMLRWEEENQQEVNVDNIKAVALRRNICTTIVFRSLKMKLQEACQVWKTLRSSQKLARLVVVSVDFGGQQAAQEFLYTIVSLPALECLVLLYIADLCHSFYKQLLLQSPSLRYLDIKPDHLSPQSLHDITLSLTQIQLPLAFLGLGCLPSSLPWLPQLQSLILSTTTLLELELYNFTFSNSEFISFMKCLESCSLTSLSLAFSSGFEATQEIVTAVLDALSNSSLLVLDVRHTPLAHNASIEAQVARNAAQHRLHLHSQSKVPATAARLFICGDPYSGKTTLVTTLLRLSARKTILSRAKAHLSCRSCVNIQSTRRSRVPRTRGIEIRELVKPGIQLQVWDMAGQDEFHAFHDHMFPDPNAQGSPALFLFVWSPMNSHNDANGTNKTVEDYEQSCRYWLKFIASKTRQSNVARKVIVVLTRKDQMDLVADRIATSTTRLMSDFRNIIHLLGPFEVDARDPPSVEEVASCIFSTAADILQNVQVYKVCHEMRSILRLKSESDPIITWKDFETLCKERFGDHDPVLAKAIASSLNESGDLIFLQDMKFLVLNTNWFCQDIMGDLIHFSKLQERARVIPVKGFAPEQYLEKLLENKKCSVGSVKGKELVDLMAALHLCCRVPNGLERRVFIPATLQASNSFSDAEKVRQWRGVEDPYVTFTFVGRRLECRRKDLTFLTPGLFPMIQVVMYEEFSKIGADVELDKNLISIYYQHVEIMVEFCKAMGEHAIDVMVRSSDLDQSIVFTFVEQEVMKAIIKICAQPMGNQGVELVEGIIRPDCLKELVSPKKRENQCVLVEDLKEDLKRQLQRVPHPGRFLHTWLRNDFLEAGASSIDDLLGIEEFSQVVKSFEVTLQKLENELGIDEEEHTPQYLKANGKLPCAHGESSLLKDIDGMNKGDVEENVVTIGRILAIAFAKLHDIDSKVDALNNKMDNVSKDIKAIVALQKKVLPKLQERIEQVLHFSVDEKVGRMPRLCFLTTQGMGSFRKLVTTLNSKVKSIRVELFCEHREQPHRIRGQEGITITMIDGWMLENALPYINKFLKVLSLIGQVGVGAMTIMAGLGKVQVPDFSKIIAYAIETCGLLNIEGIPKVDKVEEGTLAQFEGWQKWLMLVLERNGGLNDLNIGSKFKLRRARYKDNSRVAWLCDAHYKFAEPFPHIP